MNTQITDDEMRAIALGLFWFVPVRVGDDTVRAWTKDDMLNAIVIGFRAGRASVTPQHQQEVEA